MHPQAQHSLSRTRFPSGGRSGSPSVAGVAAPSRGMKEARYGEGPLLHRLLLVLSSMSPLFLLWAIRGPEMMPERRFLLWSIPGTKVMPERPFLVICVALIVLPNAWLAVLIARAVRNKIQRTIVVGDTDDHRQDIISYLFAMVLTFYAADLSDGRAVLATVAAFLIVVVLFTSLNFHYMNVVAAVLGYHCIQVHTAENGDTAASAPSFMVVVKKARLRPGSRFTGYIISPTVLLEARE